MPSTTASTPKKVAPGKEAATHGGKTPRAKADDGAVEVPAAKSRTTGKARGTGKAVAEEPAADQAHGHDKARVARAPAGEKAHGAKAHADEAHAGKVATADKPVAKAARRHDEPSGRKSVDGYAGDHKFLDSQRKSLLAERSTYVEQAESLRAEADSLVEEMEPGDIQFDEESGEGGTVTVDRERDLALSAQALVAVEEIDHALAKIDLGTYGICEGCGTLIPKNRLDALPYARLCIACKSGGLSRR